MDKVSLTIDGKKVTVNAGITVLEACQQHGIFIPTFCYDPELTKPGACRICVVEMEGARNLPASCVTIVQEGMVVKTESQQVVDARKTILELLLSNHPEDCLTCEKTGQCRLQDYAYRYGVRRGPFEGEKSEHAIDDTNPFLVRDMNKCILCGKCVRVCEEKVGRSIYSFINRGFRTKVGTAMDKDLKESECEFCGSCVSVCPTGAITEKMMHGVGRPWELSKVQTTCTYCGVGCNFDLNVRQGKVVGVTSNPSAPVNGRQLCVKGRFGYGFIHHPDRLTQPLIKKNGKFEEATWEEAVELIAGKLSQIKQDHGADAIGVVTSARITSEENYVINKFARAVIGTNNIDHCARL